MSSRFLPSLYRTIAFCALLPVMAAIPAWNASAANSLPTVDFSLPHPQPDYPDSAQLSGEQGTVLLDLYVRQNGRATRARVSQSSGYNDLDAAALQTALNWHYVPATRDGGPVSDWTTVKIVFQLPQPPAPPSN